MSSISTSSDKFNGRCLRSGLKPNFKSEPKPKNKKCDKPLVEELAKERILCLKELYKDKKLWLKQKLVLRHLSPDVILKYDKQFYMKYSKRLHEENSLTQFTKIRQLLSKSQPNKDKSSTNVSQSPKRMQLWNCSSYQSKPSNDCHFLRPRVNGLVRSADRETSIMTSPEFCRNLNLISSKDKRRMGDKQMQMSFPLRDIAKSCDYSVAQKKDIRINFENLVGNVSRRSVSIAFISGQLSQLLASYFVRRVKDWPQS